MGILEKIGLILHILRWRFSWGKRDLNFHPGSGVSSVFVTAREAVARIRSGQTVFSCGFAGTARCSVFFWAIRDRYKREGAPGNLTWINVAAQGGRGKVPGTVEELNLPGLMTTYIAGHVETTRAQLQMAEAGRLDLHTLPQGVMTYLLEAQSRGETEVRSAVGLGTMLDPRIGSGSPVLSDSPLQLVRVEGEELVYTMPKIDIALINAPYADADGNIYFHHAASINENREAAAASRANGGQVLVTVSRIIPRDDDRISMIREEVDQIVVHPYNEQSAGIRQLRFWPSLTPFGQVDPIREMRRTRYINTFLKITPVRNTVDDQLCSMAADLILRVVPKGAMTNIGVGYPEHVVWHLLRQGKGDHLKFTTEAGSLGGIPQPGIFFGSAIMPDKLISSLEMFQLYEARLGLAILGYVQVDEKGNVNASLKGHRIQDTVGPGGFMDIIYGAKVVVFVGSWHAHATYAMQEDRITLVKPGKPKFVRQVDQITFSAREALRLGKTVYYVTHVGIFRLTSAGLVLDKTAPGVDVQQDILRMCSAKIYVPDGSEGEDMQPE